MAVNFFQTSSFEKIRLQIEEHLFESVLNIEHDTARAIQAVGHFASSVERLMDILEQMYQTPGPRDQEGEKSFPICDGRYRVYFKVNVSSNQDFNITFLDIDDNRQLNLDRFPTHLMKSYHDESS